METGAFEDFEAQYRQMEEYVGILTEHAENYDRQIRRICEITAEIGDDIKTIARDIREIKDEQKKIRAQLAVLILQHTTVNENFTVINDRLCALEQANYE